LPQFQAFSVLGTGYPKLRDTQITVTPDLLAPDSSSNFTFVFFLFVFFSFPDRPTQNKKTHSTINEKKGGDGHTIMQFMTKIDPNSFPGLLVSMNDNNNSIYYSYIYNFTKIYTLYS